MVDTLTDVFQREWNLFNSDANDYNDNSNNNHLRPQQRPLTKKPSDNNNSSDYERHLSVNDYNDIPSSPSIRTQKPLSDRRSLETAYDTDGAVRTSRNISKHHHQHHHLNSSNNYEHLISPRLPVRQSTKQSTRQTASVPVQHQLSPRNHPAGTPSLANNNHNRDDRDEDSGYEAGGHRRHIRLSRRVQQQTPVLSGNHVTQNRPVSALSHHGGPRIVTPSVQPLRIIFMRHGERANQALGPDWFNRAFRTNTYRPYDENLPDYLPKRRFERAYEFDAPLTVRGLKTARLTGRSLMNHNFLADICLSSTALRCVQTCERILTGMDRRDRIAIRIEPGLFECPHVNPKIVDSFMTKKELMENRYNIKQDYKPLISKVNVPETLDEYFERSAIVMRGIIERYGHQGGTVLIVTHAPGILALTDVLKGTKPNVETFYRTVAAYPPLAAYIAEYDGTKWRYSDQPFNLVPT